MQSFTALAVLFPDRQKLTYLKQHNLSLPLQYTSIKGVCYKPSLSFYLKLGKFTKLFSLITNQMSSGLFYKYRCSSLFNSLTRSSFMKISSKHPHSPTIIARDLNSLRQYSQPLCVTCHMSCVSSHLSYVICKILHVMRSM